MKKSLFLILVLAGLSLLSLPLAVAVIGAGEDRIVIAQEVISGDKEAAAGVTLTLKSHWDGRLLWEAEYTIGEKDGTTSAFEFSDSKVCLRAETACRIPRKASRFQEYRLIW